MRQRYHDWVRETGKDCVANKEMDPCNPKGTVAKFAIANEVPFQETSVQRILYGKFRVTRQQKLMKRLFVVDLATLTVHLGVLVFIPSVPIMLYSLQAQHLYAMTMAMGDPMDFGDVYGQLFPYLPLFGGGRKQTLTLVYVIWTYNMFYIGFGLIRVFMHYIGMSRNNPVKWAYDLFFAVIFFVELVIFF